MKPSASVSNPGVIISGGGTGGHIFPAIAIADALKERIPGLRILFVGAKGRMEMTRVPAAGYEIEGLWISGLQRKISMKNLLFPVKVIASTLRSGAILRKFKPSLVIGTGGYASGTMLRTAAKKGIPTLIQEQNSLPGMTNRLLSKMVDRICVAFEGMEKYFPAGKIVITGNPVRKDILNVMHKRQEALGFFGFDPSRRVLLVLGGSLGARTINESIRAHLPALLERHIQVLWQTGAAYNDEMVAFSAPYQSKGLVTTAFISRMDLAYAAADVIVSRAGAIAISELSLVGKPVILIPSPNVAEDHQTHNAQVLSSRDAAVLLPDRDAVRLLPAAVEEIINIPGRAKSLGENILQFGRPDATARIADEALRLLRS